MSGGVKHELGANQIGVRQRIESGNSFDGTLPSTTADFKSTENVAEYGTITSTEGGLISPYEVMHIEDSVATVNMSPFIIGVYLSFDSDTEWALSTTNGRRDGSNQKLDDPLHDVEEATGWGSSFIDFHRQFLPLQCIRVTSDPTTQTAEINVILMSSISEYGVA